MLKAVRFEETDHEHLLKFISEYRNEKGKPNDSEAIRYLMQLGYDSIYAKPTIDLEQIKSDIVKNVVEAISTKIPEQTIDVQSLKKDIAKDINKKRKQQPTVNIESLKKELMEELKREMAVSNPVQPQPTNNDMMALLLTKLIDKMDNNQSSSVPNYDALNTFLNKFETLTSKPEQKVIPVEEKILEKKKQTIELPPNTDSLLANIIGNSTR